MDRRRFLQYGTAAGVAVAVARSPLGALALPGRAPARSAATGAPYVPVAQFPSGVLSGDPTADGVVLWTRIDPTVAGGGIDVDWEVATDPAFAPGSIVASGTEATSASTDHTVHVEVGGLGAGTTAWYRFTVAGTDSPIGRTKTLPASADRLRIAYFSCERFVHGYYTAHADLAGLAADPATDVDLVVSLGDYVYEAGPADDVTVDGRVDPDADQVTLEDFRRQYHLYRTDPDLQAMHAAYPFVGIFDNHDGMSGPWDASGPGAVAAFFEQMPVRRDAVDADRQHRSFALGGLAELFLLDERQHRDPLPAEEDHPLGTSSVAEPEMMAEGRTMLGAEQLAWVQAGLAGSTATWKVLGSQLMVGPLRSERYPDDPQPNAGRYVNVIQWDGYQAERRALLAAIHQAGVTDVVSIAGDTHFWTASELPLDHDDPDAPLVMTEFGGSSVTSANAGEMTNLPGNDLIRPVVAGANPYSLRFMDAETHGYGLLDLTPSRLTVTYVTVESITTPTSTSRVLARFEVDQGTATIRQVAGEGFMARPAAVVPVDPPPAGPVPADPAAPVGGQASYTG